jgi:hypothetical protein
MTITQLYIAMRADGRLQQHWEQNQLRIDRAFESPLIAHTPREVATAALLIIKMYCLSDVSGYLDVVADNDLEAFARRQGSGGARLANVMSGQVDADRAAKAAAIHTMRYYHNRGSSNPLVKAPWTDAALHKLAGSTPSELLNSALRPPWSERNVQAVIDIANLLAKDAHGTGDLRGRLRSIKGLGPERADAVGVFAFHQP